MPARRPVHVYIPRYTWMLVSPVQLDYPPFPSFWPCNRPAELFLLSRKKHNIVYTYWTYVVVAIYVVATQSHSQLERELQSFLASHPFMHLSADVSGLNPAEEEEKNPASAIATVPGIFLRFTQCYVVQETCYSA